MKNAKTILEQIVKSHLNGNMITPGIALTSMLDFYKNHQAGAADVAADDDMLLFQYGTYDWDGKGEKFQLNVTRQIADPDDDEFYQVRLTLHYKPQDIGEIESFDLWSVDKPTIEDWKEAVIATDGYMLATKLKPLDYIIDLTRT